MKIMITKNFILISKRKIYIYMFFCALLIYLFHSYKRNHFKMKEDNLNRSETIILIFGSFFYYELLPELKNICKTKENVKIIRSDKYIPHDVVILHLDHYNYFMNIVRYYKYPEKKLMVVFFMVRIFIKGSASIFNILPIP